MNSMVISALPALLFSGCSIADANEAGERRIKELEKAFASKPPAEELLAGTSGLPQLRKFFAYIGKSRHAIINCPDVVTCFVVVIS